jgi:hypothetical protein
MEPAQGIESPDVELSAVKSRRLGVQLGLGMASAVGALIASAVPEAAAPILIASAIAWLVGPGRALVRPLFRKAFKPRPGSVQLWSQSLVVRAGDAQQTVASHELSEVQLRPLTREVELRLGSGKAVSFRAPAFERVGPLLDALGVAPQRRSIAARLGPDPATLVTPWILGAALGLGFTAAFAIGTDSPVFAIWMLPCFATIAFHLVRRLEARAEIVVTSNGITLARPGGRDFLHHGGIRDVQVEPSRLRVFTDDGRELSAKVEGLRDDEREAIEGWVRERRQAFASGAAGTDAFSALDRNGRSLAAWEAALRGVLTQEGQYRRAPITAEDLGRLLTNPHTPAERRIAAAFVLSSNPSVLSEKQIRFAAESSSSQPMRIALRGLAEARIEADAIEEALAAETGSLAR